jgi:hypothetical protein
VPQGRLRGVEGRDLGADQPDEELQEVLTGGGEVVEGEGAARRGGRAGQLQVRELEGELEGVVRAGGDADLDPGPAQERLTRRRRRVREGCGDLDADAPAGTTVEEPVRQARIGDGGRRVARPPGHLDEGDVEPQRHPRVRRGARLPRVLETDTHLDGPVAGRPGRLEHGIEGEVDGVLAEEGHPPGLALVVPLRRTQSFVDELLQRPPLALVAEDRLEAVGVGRTAADRVVEPRGVGAGAVGEPDGVGERAESPEV